jgi:hypothetical protein
MIDYCVDVPRNLVVTRASGRLTVAEITNHLVRLMRDPAFKPELNSLIVAGDIHAVPGPVGVGALTPLIRAWSKRRAGARWAFVLPNRTTRDFVEAALEQAKLAAVTTCCFLSEDSALAWLAPTPTLATAPTRTGGTGSAPLRGGAATASTTLSESAR